MSRNLTKHQMEKLMIRTLFSRPGFRRAAIVGSIGCASLLSTSVFAQAPGTESTAERIVVTGSNIPTAEEVLASPLDTVTTQDIKVSGGVPDVLQILQKRNSDFVGAGNVGSSNANIASGATQGGSVVSLRGLPTWSYSKAGALPTPPPSALVDWPSPMSAFSRLHWSAGLKS